jgi:hypothetical protein
MITLPTRKTLLSKKLWKKMNHKKRGKYKRIKALSVLFALFFESTTPKVEEYVRRNFIGRISTG